MIINNNKIALGTAQWGMNYGISNISGQASAEEVAAILEIANKAGIFMLDTAALYGNSESTLGLFDLSNKKLVTKTVKFNTLSLSRVDGEQLKSEFLNSLNRLNLHSVYGLLVHDPNNLLLPGASYLIEALQELKDCNKVSKIGFSAYNSAQVRRICDLFMPDIVQLPINVFDQRLLADGTLQYLSMNCVEIHARSVFLQGLLLMNSQDIPQYFSPWMQHIYRWHQYCSKHEVSPEIAALAWVNNIAEISYSLVGIQNANQLSQLISPTRDIYLFDVNSLAINDEYLINPSLWDLSP